MTRKLYPAVTVLFKDSFGTAFRVMFPKGEYELCLKTDNSKNPRYSSPEQHIHLTRDGRIYT
jgi:hypothetical protein